MKEERIDGDTSAMPKTEEAAMRAAGAVSSYCSHINILYKYQYVCHSLDTELAKKTRFESQIALSKSHILRRLLCLVPASRRPLTCECVYGACQQVIQGVDLVMRGRAHNVFCAVRPPGHHAEPDKAMGFWYVNTFLPVLLYNIYI